MSKFKHYKPRRWHPEFDLIVIDSISGLSNVEIARRRGYSKEHISNILSTEEAEEVRVRVREKINQNFEGTLKERLAGIGEKAIERISDFITDDNLADKRPFDFVDRALRIAQAVGSVNDSDSKKGNVIVNGNMLVINKEQGQNIEKALLNSSSLDSVDFVDSSIIKEEVSIKKVG